MEYEVRFYFAKTKIDDLIGLLSNNKELIKNKKMYEKTMQFDHPNDEMSFYSKEIDGRFRIRISKNDQYSKCKLSWKQRIPATIKSDINQEVERELSIDSNEYENLMFIIEEVLKMKHVESYERYRTIFYNDEIEISIDEYPFGIALEIENKSSKNPEESIKKWVNYLKLDINNSYKLSWDDKYVELCNEQNVEVYKHVTFDLPMPKII